LTLVHLLQYRWYVGRFHGDRRTGPTKILTKKVDVFSLHNRYSIECVSDSLVGSFSVPEIVVAVQLVRYRRQVRRSRRFSKGETSIGVNGFLEGAAESELN
jgi:hypothetical protein